MLNRYYTKRSSPGKAIKSDPQRHLVYYMERAIVGWCVNTHMKRNDLLDVIEHACKKYDITPAELKIVRSKQRVFGWSLHGTITLNTKWHGDNLGVLLHELAHHIVDELELEGPSHGPQFVRIYGELLDQYKVLPYFLWLALCEKYEVEVE